MPLRVRGREPSSGPVASSWLCGAALALALAILKIRVAMRRIRRIPGASPLAGALSWRMWLTDGSARLAMRLSPMPAARKAAR